MTISQILPGLRLFSARTSIGRDYESIYDLGEFMRRKKQDWLIHSSSKPWRIYGKLGENSDANTGLRSPCPNFHPKHVWMKIRFHFGDGSSGSSEEGCFSSSFAFLPFVFGFFCSSPDSCFSCSSSLRRLF